MSIVARFTGSAFKVQRMLIIYIERKPAKQTRKGVLRPRHYSAKEAKGNSNKPKMVQSLDPGLPIVELARPSRNLCVDWKVTMAGSTGTVSIDRIYL